MRLVNLTATPVGLCDRNGQVRWYEPSGQVPKIVAKESLPLEEDTSHEVHVITRAAIEGLPAPFDQEEPILYLVDPLIAHLCSEQRWDLVSVDPTSTVGPGSLTGLVYYRRLISWDLSDRIALVQQQEA